MADRIISNIIFFVALTAASSALADMPADITLELPRKGISDSQARLLEGSWERRGLVRVIAFADHIFDYELLSGIQLIEMESEKTYNIRPSVCYVSFCLYVGRVPIGKYFVNHIYTLSHDYTWAVSTRKSMPIRNSMGSFEVKPGSITDLGLIGILGVAGGEENQFRAAFLGYHADVSALYKKLYHVRGFRERYLAKMNDVVLGWDQNEWQDSALKQVSANRMFFSDFSQAHEIEGKLFFPSVMGRIYTWDPDQGYSYRDVDTLFMLNSLWVDGEQWMAGGEAGRVYISKDKGMAWEATDAFPRDEAVVKIFKRADALHVVTISHENDSIKLYTRDGPKFLQISKTALDLEGKSNALLETLQADGKKRHLTDKKLNRDDLKKIKVHLSPGGMVVQSGKKVLSYDFEKKKWKSIANKPIRTFFAGKDGFYMLSEPYEVAEGGEAIKLEAGRKFSDQEKPARIPRVGMPGATGIFSYPVDLSRKPVIEEFLAIPRGGFYVREDGGKAAILSVIENKTHLEKPAQPQLYSIGKDSSLASMHTLEGVAFYYDSDLLPLGADVLLIDRVAPRIYRFKTGKNFTPYNLYDHAYKLLAATDKGGKP